MLTKNEIKILRSLQQKKYRQQHKLFIAEGVKVVNDLISAQYPVEKIFATEQWLNENDHQTDLPTAIISEKELLDISALKAPNQVLATCRMKPNTPAEPISTILEHDIVLFLDAIRDPGNLGTILRTADWFDIKNVFCSTDTVELYNPKVIQATMGAIANVNVFYTNTSNFFGQINDTLPVYGLYLQGENIYNVKTKNKGIIIIGSESHGISNNLKRYISHKITIPPTAHQNTHTESLNASVAAAIAMYQFRL